MKAQPITFYLPDTRGVTVSRFGQGNRKIGMGVFTYSRLPGGDATCPGATKECEMICYAKRVEGPVKGLWFTNTQTSFVPPIPTEATHLRLHVSGDFDTDFYIRNWIMRLKERPDVKAWGYTKSWRVPELLPALEELRALPNMQLFASMDASSLDFPPAGWRRAWIWRDFDAAITGPWPQEERLKNGLNGSDHNQWCITDGVPSYVCPEETGRKPDCVSCRYCIDGRQNDVTFLEH